MASTSFTYNGFTFAYPTLESYSEQIEYTQDGVDPLYTHIRARVKGFLNPDLQGGTKPAQTLINVRDELLQPRANLVLSHDGVELINQTGQDEKFGPKPVQVQVVEVIGSETLIVELEIETWQQYCTGNTPDIVSNRWSSKISYAQNQLATRTIEGRIVVRGGNNPDDYRQQIAPPIPNGFVRTGQEFKRNEDGVSLQYTFTDEEKFFNVPTPLTDWTMDISYSTQIGAKIFVNLTAEATGKKGKSAAAVFQRLVSIMQSTGVLDQRFGIPRDVKWSRSYDKNRYRVSWTTLRKEGIGNLLGDDILLQSPQVAGKPVEFPTRGTALEKLSAKSPSNACTSTKSYEGAGTGSNSTSSAGSGSSVTSGGRVSPVQRGRNALRTSQDHQKAPWLFSNVETRFETEHHIASLPVADPDKGETEFVALGSPTQKLVIHFEGERFSEKPQIPDVSDLVKKLDATLLNVKVDTASPTQLPNGDPLFAFQGVAVLGLRKPVTAASIPLSPIEVGGGGVTFQIQNNDLEERILQFITR